jgi:hypothetical protein
LTYAIIVTNNKARGRLATYEVAKGVSHAILVIYSGRNCMRK